MTPELAALIGASVGAAASLLGLLALPALRRWWRRQEAEPTGLRRDVMLQEAMRMREAISATTSRLEEKLDAARASGSTAAVADLLFRLAELQKDEGRPQLAVQSLARAAELYAGMGDRLGYGLSLKGLGDAYRDLGELNSAQKAYGDAAAVLDDIGDVAALAGVQSRLAQLYQRLGDLHAARALLERALEAYGLLGDRLRQANVLLELSRICERTGDSESAATFLSEAKELLRRLGITVDTRPAP